LQTSCRLRKKRNQKFGELGSKLCAVRKVFTQSFGVGEKSFQGQLAEEAKKRWSIETVRPENPFASTAFQSQFQIVKC
jgi:hypothetical protein